MYVGGKHPKSNINMSLNVNLVHVHVILGALILRCITSPNLMYITRYDVITL